jgi:hypothetical protein
MRPLPWVDRRLRDVALVRNYWRLVENHDQISIILLVDARIFYCIRTSRRLHPRFPVIVGEEGVVVNWPNVCTIAAFLSQLLRDLTPAPRNEKRDKATASAKTTKTRKKKTTPWIAAGTMNRPRHSAMAMSHCSYSQSRWDSGSFGYGGRC